MKKIPKDRPAKFAHRYNMPEILFRAEIPQGFLSVFINIPILYVFYTGKKLICSFVSYKLNKIG